MISTVIPGSSVGASASESSRSGGCGGSCVCMNTRNDPECATCGAVAGTIDKDAEKFTDNTRTNLTQKYDF